MINYIILVLIFFLNFSCSPQFLGKEKIITLALNKKTTLSSFSATSTSVTSSSVLLQWPVVENATSYSVRYGTSAGVYSSTVTTTLNSLSITSLSSATTYYFQVSAINSYGSTSAAEISATTLVADTPPSSPLSLTATNNGTTPTLSWAAPATGTTPITYEVFRSTTSGGPYSSVGQPTPTTLTSFDDVVVAGTNYYYVVYGANGGGSGTASSELALTPIATFNTTSVAVNNTAGAGALVVTFPAVTGATGYDIVYGTSSGTYGSTITTVTSPYTMTSLTAGTTYYIKVRARNATTTQLSTNELTGVPLSSISITNLVSTSQTVAQVSFGSSSGASSYNVYYGSATGAYSQGTGVGVSSPYTITGLTSAQSLFLKVRAINSNGYLESTESSTTLQSALTANLNYSTSTDYSMSDSNLVEFTGGLVRLKAINQTYNSNSTFGSGSYTGTQYDTTNNFVKLNTTLNNSLLDASWTPKWSNLQAYYPMDNNWNDYSGNGRNGTLNGSVVFQNTTPKIGTHSAHIPNYSTVSNIHAGTFQTNNGNLMTISVWLKMDLSVEPSDYYAIFYKADSWGQDVFYFGFENSVDKFYLDKSTSARFYTDTVDYSLHNKWAHVVLVQDNSSIDVYVNGLKVGHQNSPFGWGPGPSTAQVQFGDYYAGGMDELAVWNTNLSESEINTIYNRQKATYSGTYVSNIIDALSSQSWLSLVPQTTIPFLKELIGDRNADTTADSETTSDYSSIISNLQSGLVGLWKLNETGVSNGSTISAAIGPNGTLVRGTGDGTSSGILNNSINFKGASYIAIPESVFNFTPDQDEFTVSAWFKRNSNTQGQVFAKAHNLARQLQFFYWNTGEIGYNCGANGNYNMGIFLDINKWYHVALIDKDVAGTHYTHLYLNGKLIENSFNCGSTVASGTDFLIGARRHNDNTDYSFEMENGNIDEVAIWNRPLSSAEVLQLYRRGANRLLYQVRGCAQSDCSDQTGSGLGWKGPDGTQNTYFSELNNYDTPTISGGTGNVKATTPSYTFSDFSLTLPSSRYFQFKTFLESDDTNSLCNYGAGAAMCSPELKSTSIGPTHYPDGVTVTNSTAISFASIASFTQTLGGSGCSGSGAAGSGISYQLSLDNSTWNYWNGSSWTNSSGVLSNSNNAAIINSNITTIGSGSGSNLGLYIKSILNSSGTSSCELDNLLFSGSKY